MIRADAPSKVAGRIGYGTDLDRPGMLWGALVPAPVAHGRIRSLDLAEARRVPGVEAVIAASETEQLLPRGSRDADRPVFPTSEIQYLNQPIAAVAATSLEAARTAARLVRVDVEPLPVLADLDAIVREWPARPMRDSPQVNAYVHARWGEVDREFERADRVRKDEFRTSGVAQVALEPHACLAEVRNGIWRVESSTQTPFGVRDDVTSMLGVPESQVVVEATWVGGGFGGKGAALIEPYALVLAAATGRPVRLALTYREEFQLVRTSLPARFWIESAVRNGAIAARRVRMLLDTGGSLPGRDFATGYAIGFLLGPYRLETFEVEGYAIRTHKPPFGAHRAPMAPQCVFAIDGHTDALARDLGEDPIEFRRRNVWVEGDLTAFGQPVGPFGGEPALRAAAALRERWRAELPKGTGFGVGIGFWSTGVGAGGEARVTVEPNQVRILAGEREIGSGSVVRGLVAAAERVLGLPAEAIQVEYGDTSRAPFDSGVYGSRTLGALGGAVANACQSLLEELKQRSRASAPIGLVSRDGALFVASAGREVPVSAFLTKVELAAGGLTRPGKLYGGGHTVREDRVIEGDFYAYSDFTAAVHLAAVDVDRETGQVSVRRYAAFHDAGVQVDPATYRAQVEGGVAMGLGTALTEEMLWGPEGRLENPGLLDYRIPTLTEIPPIEVHVIEGFAGAGPFGAKGAGEPPIIPVAAAVANAVADATGARVTELPLTPERVARSLKVV